jgi:membrane protease YdiL (CAAX protease family)
VVAAWLVIVAAGLLTAGVHVVEATLLEADDEDPIGLTIMQLQAKYMVGLARSRLFAMEPEQIYHSAGFVLNAGTVGQRQRAVIVAGELLGPAGAREALEGLDTLIAAPPVGGPVTLTQRQRAVQRVLHELYPKAAGNGDAEEAAIRAAGTLGPTGRTLLVDELGWFGELALVPPGSPDADARTAVMRPARIVATVLISAAVLGLTATGAGLIGLVLAAVFTFTGHLRSGLGSARPWHGVYAETFAAWLVLFLGLQYLGAWIATPSTEMPVTLAMFVASLVALVWPVVRGIPWPQVRADVGWTLGRQPWVEPLVGVVGYLATLPLLALGLAATLVLMWVQGEVAGAQPTFGPTGGPAHPIIVHMAEAALGPKITLLALAAIAAPIVEETMFRGVLYRHLRDASAGLGIVVSVALSVVINTFIFAAIHPQGVVAVPALMSLACGMALVREWRGTLVPSMIVHGLSNGLILGMLMVVLGV